VDTIGSYRHVTWFTAFVLLYMIALYYQAAGYQSGGVVQTLRASLLPAGGSSTLRFSSERQVSTAARHTRLRTRCGRLAASAAACRAAQASGTGCCAVRTQKTAASPGAGRFPQAAARGAAAATPPRR